MLKKVECVAVVSVHYFIPCVKEWNLHGLGNHIVDYLDNQEDVEHTNISMFILMKVGNINSCQI